MLYNSLHRNKISCCQNMMVSESQTREIPQTSPIRPFCLGLWHLSIFFLCQNTFPLVHALSVLGKLLHNIEEPSSNVTSYQLFLSTPRDSQTSLLCAPMTVCVSLQIWGKDLFTIFPVPDNSGVSLWWIFDDESPLENCYFLRVIHMVWERLIHSQLQR